MPFGNIMASKTPERVFVSDDMNAALIVLVELP